MTPVMHRLWHKQLRRVGSAIDLLEAAERSGGLIDPDDYRVALKHLYTIRSGLERQLNIAPPLSRRP